MKLTPNREVIHYNDEKGIQKSSYSCNSINIDNEGNIWCIYNYRRTGQWNQLLMPSVYKIHANREEVTEYVFEDVVKNSKVYSDDINEKIEFHHESHLIKWNSFRGSLFISMSNSPMLEFYPKGLPPTSIKDFTLPPRVYPNPVPQGRNVFVQSEDFVGVHSQVKIVVRDISGAIVKENLYTIGSDDALISINTEGLIRGSYFVSVHKNNNIILQTTFIQE